MNQKTPDTPKGAGRPKGSTNRKGRKGGDISRTVRFGEISWHGLTLEGVTVQFRLFQNEMEYLTAYHEAAKGIWPQIIISDIYRIFVLLVLPQRAFRDFIMHTPPTHRRMIGN